MLAWPGLLFLGHTVDIHAAVVENLLMSEIVEPDPAPSSVSEKSEQQRALRANRHATRRQPGLQRCPQCHGTGVVGHRRSTTGGRDNRNCPACAGTGSVGFAEPIDHR